MELVISSYGLIYMILLCALAKGGSEGKRWIPEEFLQDGGHLSLLLAMEGNKAQKVWKRCIEELEEKTNVDKDFDLEGGSDLRSAFLKVRNIKKAIKSLPPQTTQNLLDCIREKSLTIPVSEENTGSKNWLNEYFGLLSHGSEGHRRNMVADASDNLRVKALYQPMAADASDNLRVKALHQPVLPAHGNMVKSPSDVPATISPSPSPDQSPGPTVKSPSDGPAPASSPSPIVESPADSFVTFVLSPDFFKESPPPPPPKSCPPIPHYILPPPLPDSNHPKIISYVAFAAAASAFVTLIALVLFCCLKEDDSEEVEPKVERNENSQLTLNLNDSSVGSQVLVGLGNSDQKETGNNNDLKETCINNGTNCSVISNVSTAPEGAGLVPGPPSNPPPGASAPPPPAPRPPPPPPPRAAQSPPVPPKLMAGKKQSSPPAPVRHQRKASKEAGESDASKPKLKPFFWDKVAAKPDQEMVWNEIRAGSFQFNEQRMESLFGCANQNRNENKKGSPSLEPSVQYVKIIEPKKAQNLSILLRALNVTTEEVVDALKEGNEIHVELCQTLLKMAPTTEEELKLRLFTGELCQLSPAEKFLKVLVDIPFAFKRLESLVFMTTLSEEISSIMESFAILEGACNELRKSRLFLKLLEAVLKTGNRMNDGTFRGGAQAFKLDTLLKLSDVKGIDGKTTLLHFVVQEIIRSEGKRAVRTKKASRSLTSEATSNFVEDANDQSEERYRSLGLQLVSRLSSELEEVKMAAVIDGEGLTAAVIRIGQSLIKSRTFLNTDMKNVEEDSQFHRSLASFVEKAESDVTSVLEEEKRIMALVKSTADYFHGNSGKDEGLRLFVVVRDFLMILDNVCKEVKATTEKAAKTSKKEAHSESSSPETHQTPPDNRQRLFPAIAARRMDELSSDSSSDDD